MSGKFFLYVIITILVIWAMDSININGIFKKNRIIQARVFSIRNIYDIFSNKFYMGFIYNS